MTEQEALDLVNEIRREWGHTRAPSRWIDRKVNSQDEALCRAIEQRNAERDLRHKAEQALADHKADVSEEVKACFGTSHPAHPLQRFIIPTPDPLYECVREALPGSMPDHHALAITKNLRAAAAKRGLERIDQ